MNAKNYNTYRSGVLLGALVPLLTFLGYHELYYSYLTVPKLVDFLMQSNSLSMKITMCVVLNMGLLFAFVQSEKYVKMGKGVMTSTFIYA